MLNRFNEIKLSDVRERTKMALRLQNTTEQDDYIEVLVLEGLRHLNTNFNLRKFACCLDIEDHKAFLPKGISQVIGLRLFGSDGNCINFWYADKKFIDNCECNFDNVTSCIGTYLINGQYIHFNTSIDATKCQIAYLGLNTNIDGELIIYEDYERALMAYACWQFMLTNFQDYPMNLTFERKKEWIAQKSYLKGAAQVEDFQRNKREIQNIFKSLTVSNILNT